MLFKFPDKSEPTGDTPEATQILASVSSAFSNGRVFIGFPTHQTTGSFFSLCAQVIPTIERENLDFNFPHIKKWNKDLLLNCGRVMRLFYDHYMNTTPLESDQLMLIHGLGFHPTNPSKKVGQLIEKGFFATKFWSPSIPSSEGLKRSTQLRKPLFGMERFCNYPVVSEVLLEEKNGESFCKALEKLYYLHPVTVRDVTRNFQEKILKEEELTAFLNWFITSASKVEDATLKLFTSAIHYKSEFSADNIYLDKIVYYPKASIESFHPLALSWNVSKNFTERDLKEGLMLKPLPFMVWWDYIVSSTNVTSPSTSPLILKHLSSNWSALNPAERTIVSVSLSTKASIPTTHFKLLPPNEVYFPNIKFPKDLPLVSEDLSSEIPTPILKAIGIRDSVPIDLVLSRINEEGFDIISIINFLCDVKDNLTPQDMEFLTKSPFLHEVGGRTRLASELHFPNSMLDGIPVPILNYPGRISGAEELFLEELGVRKLPELTFILKILSETQNQETYRYTFKYFIAHFESHYKVEYSSIDIENIPPFVPVVGGKERPDRCFSIDLGALLSEYLGVRIVEAEYRGAVTSFPGLRVKGHIEMETIFNIIIDKPMNRLISEALFDYLGSRLGEIGDALLLRLKEIKFIPIQGDLFGRIDEIFPESLKQKWGPLLHYVQYSNWGMSFLSRLGLSDVPSNRCLAEGLVEHHTEYLNYAGNDQYQQLLIQISQNWQDVPLELRKKMKETPILLCYQLNRDNSKNIAPCIAKHCYLIDNMDFQRIFNPPCGPVLWNKDLISLYSKLGSKWLSREVTQFPTAIGLPRDTERCQSFFDLVQQRMNLFLYDLHTFELHKHLEPNAISLLKRIKFQTVDKIRQILVFNAERHNTEINTCCYKLDQQPIVYFTDSAETYEIAAEISRIIYINPRVEDDTIIASVLMTSLSTLRKNGYPVDQLLEIQTVEPINQEEHSVIEISPPQHQSHPQGTTQHTEPNQSNATQNTSLVLTLRNSSANEDTVFEYEEQSFEETEIIDYEKPIEEQSSAFRQQIHSEYARVAFLQSIAKHTNPQKMLEKLKPQVLNIVLTNCTKDEYVLSHIAEVKGISILSDVKIKVDFSKYEYVVGDMAQIISEIAEIFGIHLENLSIYLGHPTSSSFNLQNRLHFNLLTFSSLNHHHRDISAWFYWYTLFTHQLAHNVFPEDSPQHSLLAHSLTTQGALSLFNVLQNYFPVVGMGDCRICYDRKIDVVILECGHLVLCEVCAGNVKKCPICRKDITRTKLVYLQ
uniref:RING-type domain-containing protein n=1 Tax=Arcella intermedia TaxID=1963864 RepID=A0A6B2KW84_9EUKA